FRDGPFDPTDRLITERLCVLTEVALVLPEDARREPQLSDCRALEQLLEPAAVILIGVREDKEGQVRFPVSLRQQWNETVENWQTRIVIFVRTLEMMEVDLHDRLNVNDDSRAIAAADRPKDKTLAWQLYSHIVPSIISHRDTSC